MPPAHFGYMASGIDDEVTLRANREGFQKFVLRPRRLVDVSKVDMIDRNPRREIQQPDHRRADRRPQGLSCRRRGRRRPRRQGRRPPDDPVDAGHHLDRGRDRRARQADLVPALCDQQLRGRQAPRAERGEGQGAHRGRGDRRPQRRPQPGNPVPAAAHRHRATARTATTTATLAARNIAQADVRRRRHERAARTSNPRP